MIMHWTFIYCGYRSCLFSASIYFSLMFMTSCRWCFSLGAEGRRGRGGRLGLFYCLILSASKAGGGRGGKGGRSVGLLYCLILSASKEGEAGGGGGRRLGPFYCLISLLPKNSSRGHDNIDRDLSLGEGKPDHQGWGDHGSCLSKNIFYHYKCSWDASILSWDNQLVSL